VRAALDRLAAATTRVAHAQLAAHGCAPLAPSDIAPAANPAEQAGMWLAGRRHADAVIAAAAELGMSAGLADLEPDLVSAVTELASPAEVLVALGGDDRQVPVDGRNAYRLPLYDLAPRIRLSSCTATPPDRLTLECVDRWRRRMLDQVLSSASPPTPGVLHRDIAERLCHSLGLADGAGRVVLAASGTHIESLATAFAAAGSARPLVNIMVGIHEAGSGSALAAAGRAFHIRSPFRSDSQPGSLIAGFDEYDVRLVDVDVRDAVGRPRRAFDVEAEIEAHLESALDEGARVLVHVLDGSKTGLHQPSLAWVRHWRAAHPDRMRVIVDGAQGRIPTSRVRSYLAAGASVSLTGSKSIGGPPFCGALLLDDGLLTDAVSMARLPLGFGAFLSRMELPPSLQRLTEHLPAANYGLAARWHAALSEWEAFLSIPSHLRGAVEMQVIDQLRASLADTPGLHVLDDLAAAPSIVTFQISDGHGGFLARESLKQVYASLVERPGVQVGQPVELVPNRMAALRFAVGMPTVNRLVDTAHPMAAARTMATEAVALVSESLRDPTRA
jgi:hypothetical protein